MSAHSAKLLLGVLVLLAWPCFGSGGRAEARFALTSETTKAARAPGSPGFELRLVLNGEESEEPATRPASSGANPEPPLAPVDQPKPTNHRHVLPAPFGTQNGGSSTTGSSSAGSPSGIGLSFILPSPTTAPGPEQSGRLFLADERYKPPPFASRWYRPPR